MILHKILLGEGAELYLPFGLSRLRAYADLYGPKGFFQEKFLVNGVQVEIQQAPPYQYVRVTATAGVFYFEFQTSGFPIVTHVDARFGTLYKAAAVGVVVSSTGANAVLLGNERVNDTMTTSLIARAQQVQLHDEPAHYPGPQAGGKYTRVVYESSAPFNPHTGIHLRSYHCEMVPWGLNNNRSAIIPHGTRDVAYDVGYADNQNKEAVRYAYLRGSADWPRASGVRTVTDPTYGTREFAVYVDAFDQVSVFPLSQITAFLGEDGGEDPIQNVDPMYIQMARVAFPSWTYCKSERFLDFYAANPGNTGLTDFPEYDWKVHPDGTKMCAVVYEREPALFDSTFYGNALYSHAWDGTSGFSGFLPDATSWDGLNTYIAGMYPQLGVVGEGAGATRYMSATGLLEVGITITLTGSNPEDFTLALVTPTEVRRPTTSPYCTLLAGYTWHDVLDPSSTADIKVYQAHRGDLCVLDAECYGRVSDGACASLLSLKNLTRSTELRAFSAENEDRFGSPGPFVATGIAKVLAYDMQTLSFAIKHSHKVKTFVGSTGTRAVHFGIGIYVMNRYKTTLFPDTLDDPVLQDTINAPIITDARQAIADGLGALTLMPVNDLRDWTDTDLSSLREDYDTPRIAPGTFGSFSSVSPDLWGNQYMQTLGFKYEVLTRVNPTTTSDAGNWFYNCLPQGRFTPFMIFNLATPRPGWYQYMGELMSRVQISPYTTFFAHPNGSWAFFNQEFLYNKAGMGYTLSSTAVTNDTQTASVALSTSNFEHCIFDVVHFAGSKPLSTSFRALYNAAVNAAITAGTLLDSAAPVELSDMRATFTKDTVADGIDATVVYDSLKIDWQGYTARMTDHGYFSGHKVMDSTNPAFLIPNWEPLDDGLLQCASLGAYWKNLAGTDFVVPQESAKPVTFSSCVMIGA